NSDLIYPVELTWAHRNRLQETSGLLLSYFDGSVTPEPGVTYSVRVVELNPDGTDGDTLHTETDIAGESWSLPFSVVDGTDAAVLRIGVSAHRDGFESIAEASILIPGSLQAPTGLTATA